MVRTCPNCGEKTPERARFCPVCGMALAAIPGPAGVRKVVTIVFCDLVGSTSLGESLDPESLRQVITRYFETMSAALRRHGGTIEKFIGDAVMAVFGIPTAHEDDALRAVRAAVEMRNALVDLNEQLELRWGVRLQARTGVNTGEVIAGDSSEGQAYASGDAVNVAARLEQAASPGEILIGEHTFELVRDAVLVEPVTPLELKGKSEPVPAFRLLDVADLPAARVRRLDSPLVGRNAELALLQEAFDRTVAGQTCELVTLVGAPGIGKSRLAEDFTHQLRGEAIVVAGRCLSYGEGLTFWPLREVVEQLAATDDKESSEEALARIARLLPTDDDTAAIVERVAGAMGLTDAAAYPAETFWAVRRLLEAVAARRPLVVLFEDIHWAEPTFLELIEHLAGTVREAPILIVATARTDLFDVRPEFAGTLDSATKLELEPLSGDESSALIEHLIGDPGVDAEFSDRVHSGAEGNPLFIGELVRMLVDERRIEKDEAGVSSVPELSKVSVPRTLHALLAARLDRLEPAEHAVAEAAAVVGRSFGGGAVFELSRADDRSEVDRHLSTLVRKQLIWPDGGRFAGEETFSFNHILLRDVAYQGILKGRRSDLHARLAEWLERTAAERAGEYEEILGHHLEQAYRNLSELGPIDEQGRELATRAAARLGSSGGRALARGDIRPAVTLLERAVDLLPEDDPARRDLTVKLGIALAEAGQVSRAGALLHDRIEAERRGSAFVSFQDEAGKQHIVTLGEEESAITVGRRLENDVALSWDGEVSRAHARLLRGHDGWALVDEGSRNGSYLNGQRITGRQPLRDGDVLRFGDTVVLFRAPVSDERRQAVSLQPEQSTYMGRRTPIPPRPSQSDRG
jgi:class 3 adenylate cyclase